MNNRRDFLKKAGAGALGLTIGGVLPGFCVSVPGRLAGVNGISPLANARLTGANVHIHAEDKKFKYVKGGKIFPTTPYGPLSAGLPNAGTAFMPADGTGESVIFTRIWDEAYMYPGFEMNRPPVRISNGLGGCRGLTPVDWNHDGIEDFVVTERTGFLFLYEQVVKEGRILIEERETIRDHQTGHVFNIQFYHPEFGYEDDLGGYTSIGFANYLFPAHYPARAGRADLIIGDSAGKLWWLPDESTGNETPKYSGKTYKKEENLLVNAFGRSMVEKYGDHFAEPREQLLNENGEPFVVGDFFENGKSYHGGISRPVAFLNEQTGLYDLLVGAGCREFVIHYLKCLRVDDGKPVFKDMGDVTPEWVVKQGFYFHTSQAFSVKNKKLYIAYESNRIYGYDFVWENGMPAFRNARMVMAENTGVIGYLAENLLFDKKSGKTFITDFPNKLCLREIERKPDNVRISSDIIELKSNGKPVEPKGVTDPQAGELWGFHRSALWDYDKSGKNHFIIGTDTGNLLLVRDTGEYFTTGNCALSDYLKDTDGEVIKVHNRAKAVAFDLDGDGRDDLIVGGQSYQMGIPLDPDPGSGFVAYLNRGVDGDGLPILEKTPLVVNGHTFATGVNRHIHLGVADIDHDGAVEVILSVQQEGFAGRIFKKVPGKTELYYTGSYIENFHIDDSLMDIDGDGALEVVFGGGETGFVVYHKIIPSSL